MKINSIESVDNNAVENNTTTTSTTSSNNLNIDYNALASALAKVMGGNNAPATNTEKAKDSVDSNNLSVKGGMRFDETQEDYINRKAEEKIAKEKEATELRGLCDKFVEKEYLERVDSYFSSAEDKEKILKALALDGMLLKFDSNSLLSRMSNGTKPYKLLVGSDEGLAEEFLKLGAGEDPKAKAELRANNIGKYWHLKEKLENAVAIQEKSVASNEAYAKAFAKNEESLQAQFIKRSASRFGLKGY